MEPLKLAQTIFTLFTGIGLLAAGLGYAYERLTSGRIKFKDDLITTLQETAKAEKEKASRLAAEKLTLETSHQEQINSLNMEVGKLKGLYQSSELQKKEYLAILQDRDPAQQKFMEMMINAAQESQKTTAAAQKYMTDSIVILGEIRTFMHSLNEDAKVLKEKAKKTEVFQKEVIQATAQETGKPLRKN